MSYQPPALPSRGKQNSHMKTQCQTPRKAFQCPLPRRGSHYNGAWTSAMSPGRGEAISFHLTQFAGPRRRLMSSPQPRSHRYHFPNQVTKLVLKLLQRGQADCSQRGILLAIWPQFLPRASASVPVAGGNSWRLCLCFGGTLPSNA